VANPDWWPREPAGYVFLSHVVEKIGNALHGDDWTGEEATAEEIEPLPRRRKDASQANLLDAERLLQHYRPDLKRPAVIGWNEFSEKHWKIAYDLAQRLRPALDRLHATQSEIVKMNETAELELRIQPRNGGPWRDFNKDWWNTDKLRLHFNRCRIDPDYPNGRPSWSTEDNDHWIFATSQSVEEAAAAVVADQLEGQQKTKPGLKTARTNEIPRFVSDYIKDNPTTASQSGCREKWKSLHGARRRVELDAEWRKQAELKGLLRERGQRGEIAKKIAKK
jgi:hypothetical protein